MDKNKLAACILICIALVAMCSLTVNALSPQKVDPAKDSIQMVDVCGWPWCAGYDQQYAEHVNQPNSEANRNNGEANLYNAQATQIASETGETQKAVAMTGAIAGILATVICVILLLLGLLLLKQIL